MPPGRAPIPSVVAIPWRPAGADGLEVFLVQRAYTLGFFGGYWAFPGGRIEEADHATPVAGAAGDAAAAIAAAVREVGEEIGLALPARADRFLPAGRFVTPEQSPIRFDCLYFLVELGPKEAPDHAASGGELVAGEWIAPADALARRQQAAWLLPSPVVRVLDALAGGPAGAAERCRAAAAAEAASPRLYDIIPGVAVCPVRTPTLPPATHTNCYVVGGREVVVIDPASPYEDEQAVLDGVLDGIGAAGRRVVEIWLTHHHGDHVGGAARLAARLGVPIAAEARTAALVAPAIRVDRLLVDGERRELAGPPRRVLRALHTPGHAPGHLCFLEEESGLLVAGDMVAAVGTIVIDPVEGDMRQYLDSLALLRALAPRALLPAHGGVIADSIGKIDEYVRHRRWREERVVAALAERGRARAAELVPPVYADVSPALFALAERSLVAHLIKLVADGRVQQEGEVWTAGGALL